MNTIKLQTNCKETIKAIQNKYHVESFYGIEYLCVNWTIDDNSCTALFVDKSIYETELNEIN